MERFWDLLQESVIVQGLVTFILVLTLCFMFVTGKEIPQLLTNITMLVFGFWFGSKSAQSIAKIRRL